MAGKLDIGVSSFLKGKCHEESLAFYYMRCCFRPKQWSARAGYTFFRSCVRELRFVSGKPQLCILDEMALNKSASPPEDYRIRLQP